MVAGIGSHHHKFVDRIYILKSNIMFTERNVPELTIVEQSALRRQVAVMVLVPQKSNCMKGLKEEQAKKPALGRAVTDFIEDMVTSWMVANLDETDVTMRDCSKLWLFYVDKQSGKPVQD